MTQAVKKQKELNEQVFFPKSVELQRFVNELISCQLLNYSSDLHIVSSNNECDRSQLIISFGNVKKLNVHLNINMVCTVCA